MENFEFCQKCRFLGQPHYKSCESGEVDLLIIVDCPESFDCKKGRPASNSLRPLKTLLMENRGKVRIRLQFALGCAPFSKEGHPDLTIKDVRRCAPRLKQYIAEVKPKVILAMGMKSCQALGIKKGIKGARGQIFDVDIDGHSFKAVVTNGIREISKSPGLYGLLEKDFKKAVALCSGEFEKPEMALEIPSGCNEVVSALKRAHGEIETAFMESGKKQVLVFDLETTALAHYKENERIIAVSLSWKNNHALAFLLDHRDASHTPKEIEAILEALSALFNPEIVMTCGANTKFDYSWLHFAYGLNIKFPDIDVLLIEHLLEEDKKGEYNLKKLVVDYCPAFSGYEDVLGNELAAVGKRHEEEYRARKQDALDQYLKKWVDFSDEKRRDLLTSWVKSRHLPATDIDQLYKLKTVKGSGGKRVSKSYLNSMGQRLAQIPPEKLDIQLPGKRETTYEDVPSAIMLEYAALDAVLTREVFRNQMERMSAECKKDALTGVSEYTRPLLNVYFEHTAPLSEPIAEMQHFGVRIHRERALEYLKHMDHALSHYKRLIFEEAGREFNLGANSIDLRKVLFDEMGYKADKSQMRKTGPSTDINALKKMDEETDTDFISNLISYRKVEKVKGTYISKWYDLSALDGYVRFALYQNGTATYRLSSAEPGIQNVPTYLEQEGLNIKALFIPDSRDYEFYDLDIANAEMRVLCAYSQDERLIDAFNNGMDIHCLTGANISNYSYNELYANKEDKTSDQYRIRQLSKGVNFGVIYLMSAKGLKSTLWTNNRIALSEKEAQAYLDQFFNAYPGVREYIAFTKNFAKQHGFVVSNTGRKRRFPLAGNSTQQLARAYRQAVNFRIQTTAADLINANLLALSDRIKPLGGRVILTVHDSILFQLPKGISGVRDILDEVIIEDTKKHFPWLPVDWVYDVGKGPNYGECTEKV